MAEDLVEKASSLFSHGEKDSARQLLLQCINQGTSNPNAWYGLFFCVDDVEQKKECLRHILAINPNYPRIRIMLNDLETGKTPPNYPDQVLGQCVEPVENVLIQKTESVSTVYPAKPILPDGNVAGRSTREMARKRRSAALWIALPFLLVVGAIGFCALPNAKQFGIGGGGILMLLLFLYFSRDILDIFTDNKFKEAKRAECGAIAEEKVGALLESLGPDFLVLNDVECRYGNIDHVVISKSGGIFMIETKSHRGKITIENGKLLVSRRVPEKNFIAQSLRNSYWLRDQLEPVMGTKPWITPILVFTNAFVGRIKPIKGIYIVNIDYLLNTIRNDAKNNTAISSIWEKRGQIIGQLS